MPTLLYDKQIDAICLNIKPLLSALEFHEHFWVLVLVLFGDIE